MALRRKRNEEAAEWVERALDAHLYNPKASNMQALRAFRKVVEYVEGWDEAGELPGPPAAALQAIWDYALWEEYR